MDSNLDKVDCYSGFSNCVVALVKPLFFVGLVIITRGQHNLAFLVGVDEGRFS